MGRQAKGKWMMKTPFFQQGMRGCFFSLAGILVALSALSLSTRHLHPESKDCGGMLGAGYPVLFICDDWGGGSPTGSWGKIDLVDVLNGGIRPAGFLMDFLFYFGVLWVVGVAASRLFHFGTKHGTFWWATFIGFGFIFGLLCAYWIIQSSDLYLRNSPLTGTPTSFPAGLVDGSPTP
jgi:hypothetical protein